MLASVVELPNSSKAVKSSFAKHLLADVKSMKISVIIFFFIFSSVGLLVCWTRNVITNTILASSSFAYHHFNYPRGEGKTDNFFKIIFKRYLDG